MSFELQVDFTGLCLFLVHKDGRQVAVLQPDCRPRSSNHMYHKDETQGVPHVGYLRFDLANFAAAVAPGTQIPPATLGDGPQSEVVYRFNQQELDFGFGAGTRRMTGKPKVPDFGKIANEPNPARGEPPLPLVEPLPGLFSRDPKVVPDALLMRTILHGGRLSPQGLDERWKFSRLFSYASSTYESKFRSVMRWTREVDTDTLTIRIADFNGKNPVHIPLKPAARGGVVSLKIANLCAENPLEWKELGDRQVIGDDQDFKWLYRLLRPTPGPETEDGKARERKFEDLLLGCPFPIPQRPRNQTAGVEDCFPGQLAVETFG